MPLSEYLRNILVTGGAGFIGSHLIRRFLAEGVRVVCYDNFSSYYDPELKRENIRPFLESEGFSLVEANIMDGSSLRKVFAQHSFDAVVHLAAIVGVRYSLSHPATYFDVNVKGTLNLLEEARRARVSKIIFASSSSVYGMNSQVPFKEDDPAIHPISPYAASKRAAELLCFTYHHLYGLDVFCLRFFTAYGPAQRPEMAIHTFTRCLEEGSPIPFYGDGESARDYTYIDDIVDGIIKSVQFVKGFEIINLGQSRTVTLKRLVELLEAALNKKAKLKKMPLQPGDMLITRADISKAVDILGYRPTTSIEEGIKRFVEWYRNKAAQRETGGTTIGSNVRGK